MCVPRKSSYLLLAPGARSPLIDGFSSKHCTALIYALFSSGHKVSHSLRIDAVSTVHGLSDEYESGAGPCGRYCRFEGAFPESCATLCSAIPASLSEPAVSAALKLAAAAERGSSVRSDSVIRMANPSDLRSHRATWRVRISEKKHMPDWSLAYVSTLTTEAQQRAQVPLSEGEVWN